MSIRQAPRASSTAALAAIALLFVAPAHAQRQDAMEQALQACERQVMRDQRADRRDVRIDRSDTSGPWLRVQGSVRRDGPDVRYTCSVSRRDPGRVASVDYSGGGNRPGGERPGSGWPDGPGGNRPGNNRPIDPGLQQAATRTCVNEVAQRNGVQPQVITVTRVRRDNGQVRIDTFFSQERSSDRNAYCYFDDRGRLLRIVGP